MSSSTKVLVMQAVTARAKRYVLPAALSAAVALTAVAVENHLTGVHAAAGMGAGTAASPLDDRSVAALTSLDQAMESLTARVEPSVVNIAVISAPSEEDTAQEDTAQEDGQEDGRQGGQNGGRSGGQAIPPGLQQFFGPGGPFSGGFGGRGGAQMRPQQPELQHGIGSGVIISPDGYILTNNHVIEGARDIKVTLHDRRVLTGHVVGADKLTDLAVVKVNGGELPAIAWGDSTKLEQGQTVLAFGSPFGSLRFSVTRGIVSAVNRSDPYRSDARKPGAYIQTDAAVNPGNSGGPLVDAHGQLVGINCSIITDSGSFAGASFAIPSQLARAVSTQLIQHGVVEHGYLGIAMNDVTPENAHFFHLQDASGAIVAEVTPDSPASHAGLEQGDVITQLNGGKILDSSALQVAVSELSPGTGLTLGVMRDGKLSSVHLSVGQYHAKTEQVAAHNGESPANNGKLGLAIGDLTEDTREQLHVPASIHGAVIEQVRPASPAEDAGLAPGDIILQVDRKPTTSANQFLSEVHNNPANQDILLLVWSRGNASYRTVHAEGQNG